ncbi:unnamed protein product [Ranitomeya imitator]|uniref:Uncharacterized protein n=1 Tax=Ranitomeya imitator TaxID=111125 RepID=A0ABN9LLI8_9NEOB|nr:unnamed protein product [Ranitomeya imitator]
MFVILVGKIKVLLDEAKNQLTMVLDWMVYASIKLLAISRISSGVNSYIRYSQICARAVRAALKPQLKLEADKLSVANVKLIKPKKDVMYSCLICNPKKGSIADDRCGRFCLMINPRVYTSCTEESLLEPDKLNKCPSILQQAFLLQLFLDHKAGGQSVEICS